MPDAIMPILPGKGRSSQQAERRARRRLRISNASVPRWPPRLALLVEDPASRGRDRIPPLDTCHKPHQADAPVYHLFGAMRPDNLR